MAIVGVKTFFSRYPDIFCVISYNDFWKLRETVHQRPQNQRFNLPPPGGTHHDMDPQRFRKHRLECVLGCYWKTLVIKSIQCFRISMLLPQPKLLPLLWQWQRAPKPASQCQAIPLKTKTLTNTFLGWINQKRIYKWMMSILYFWLRN